MDVTLLQKILKAEKLSRRLDPEHETRYAWGMASLNHALNYLNDLRGSRMFLQETDQAKKLLDYGISKEGIELEDALSIIKDDLDSNGLKAASGGHMAYIPGGGLFPSGMGDFIAAICNYYAGAFYVAPGAVRMENLLIRWVAEFIGYDPQLCQGNLSSGGSYAGLIAMHTAREQLNITATEVPKTVIYLSAQTHHALSKALHVIGLKEAIYRKIELDHAYRIIPEALEQQIEEDLKNGLRPSIIIGSAGTTDVGAIDPLDKLAKIAQKYGIWFHVDAAYGGFFLLLDEMKAHFKGIEKSDSMVIDPHKGMFMPWGTGMVLIREGDKLLSSFASDAAYLQDLVEDEIEYSPSDLSPELTKHFRGLRVWLPLQLFGENSFKAALREKLLLCSYAYEKLQKINGIELPLKPQLSVILFRHIGSDDPDSFNLQLIKSILSDGRIFISSTRLGSQVYLRLTILHFRTHLEEVDLFLHILQKKIAELS
ncbi:MAG: aminotransferase class V-fold PLP-dependent enzyme [Bacteroidota bacterium]